jgi:transglutaminase/protease-like cytokinesis protein 3
MTLSDFNSNVQNALIQAIANAAGVDVSQVSITGYNSASLGSTRRLLAVNQIDKNILSVQVMIQDTASSTPIRKISKISIYSFTGQPKNKEGESFIRSKNHFKYKKMDFNVLSETWVPDHHIQISKLK